MGRVVVSGFEAEYQRYKRLGEGALAQIRDDELADRSEGDNSPATIVWHISGNLESRFSDFLTTDGEKPWRDRDTEFLLRHCSRDELLAKWERGWGILQRTLAGLNDADLPRQVIIRGVALRADESLLRSLAHTSYHVGQITYIAKHLRGSAWRSLSIPPGQSAAYNANPTLEKGFLKT